MVTGQLDLFDHSPEPRRRPSRDAEPIAPATPTPEIEALARELPPGVRLGTSSWSFPGWAGIVYAGPASERTLAQSGLEAYVRHPLMRTVGIDRTYYAPLKAEEFARYAAVAPSDFRFLVKAFDECLSPTRSARSGQNRRRRERNPAFLEPAFAVETVIRPAVEGLGERLGPIVFQFAPLNLRSLGGPNAFIERLRTFLLALPGGPLYAVELRNEELLCERYLEALSAAGAAHCFNVHPSMPRIAAQIEFVSDACGPACVVRWMLGGDQQYDEAKDRYAPFSRLVDEDPESRESIATLCINAVARNLPVYTIVNNKAEGSAPLSIEKLAGRIVALRRV
ncbi:MAG: DUF72 domain-containing protein [Planctomycetes bacterium]|nr:DUF72 domain-containing protein [Planctomycetota bacterium]